MPESPFRSRRLDPSEVRAALRRALAQAERDGGGVGMSDEELAQHLAELGLLPEGARAEPGVDVAAGGESSRYLAERDLPGEVPTHRRGEVERALTGAMSRPGRVERGERELVWQTLDDADDLRVSVRSVGGRTRVRIEQSFRHRWVKPLRNAAVATCFFVLLAMLVAGWMRTLPLPFSLMVLMGMATLATIAGGAWSSRLIELSVERRTAALAGAMDAVVGATRVAIGSGPRIAIVRSHDAAEEVDEAEDGVAETPRPEMRR